MTTPLFVFREVKKWQGLVVQSNSQVSLNIKKP